MSDTVHGKYTIQFFVNGAKKEVTVDDLIPCSELGDLNMLLPCFAHTDVAGELWPSLLEKAWAKLHHSYSITRQGSASLIFSSLTGAPTERYDHCFIKDTETIWFAL